MVIDTFSKKAYFIPCKQVPMAKKLATLFLQQIVRLHSFPERVVSGQEAQFTAKFWKEFLSLVGTEQALSSAYHLQMDDKLRGQSAA